MHTSSPVLMASVASFSRGCTVGRNMRMEDPDIKESASFVFVPDVLYPDV